MVDSFISTLPLWGKIVTYVLSGSFVAAGVLFVPDRFLIWLGSHKRWTPNYLSSYRLPLCLMAFWIYFFVNHFWGAMAIVFAFSWDKLDGRQARLLADIYEKAKKMGLSLKNLHPGITLIGKCLDPLIDKLTMPWMLVGFSWKGFLDGWLLIGMLVCEAAGTIIRPPVPDLLTKLELFLRKETLEQKSWVRHLSQRYVLDSAATDIGKIKWGAQVVTMISCMPLHQQWCTYTWIIPNGLLLITTILAGCSVASRLRFRSEKVQVGMPANSP